MAATGDPQVITDVGLPAALAEKIGDLSEVISGFDDPGNTWVVGEEGELFEYEFVANQYARSGPSSRGRWRPEPLTRLLLAQA